MSKKNIRFTIFNEEFWEKGLIYTQNLLPLIKLLENSRGLYNIEVYSFLSILDLVLYRKEINEFTKEFKSLGIKTIIYPTFFVRSRFFVQRWFVLPLLIISTYPYLIYLMAKDFVLSDKIVVYHLRSYPVAFLFNYFYKGSGRLIFDPRSDFNHENKKIGFWKENSLTDKMWCAIERKILTNSSAVIFISEPFRDDLLRRHKIEESNKKHFLFYNSIDFTNFQEAFEADRDIDKVRLLYTGSLNNWNNIETYLDFFLNLKKFLPAATFYIATSTRSKSFQHLLDIEKYQKIIKDVTFFYGLSYSQLPLLYKGCSVGLQLMDKPDSRIGVKFVEYLASGLIPVVNSNVRGAARLCEDGLGIIVDDRINENFENICRRMLCALENNILYNRHKSVVLSNKHRFDVNFTYDILRKIYDVE